MSLDGSTVNIEDKPLLWIEETYYNTYNGNTFVLPTNAGNDIWAGDAIDYAAVAVIIIENKSLTTDFTSTLLSKFRNLSRLLLSQNSITTVDVTNNPLLERLFVGNTNVSSIDLSNNPLLKNFGSGNANLSTLDLSNNPLLTELRIWGNDLSTIDLSNNPLVETLELFANTNITNIDLSNNPLLTYVRTQSTKSDELVNSQILIDLDGHELSNGYFQSSIFGGGYLSPLGVEAFINIQSKGWTIVGLSILLTTSTSYDIEYFPLAWIEENNFGTYNADTFQVASDRNMPTQSQNDAVTSINLQNQSLTTDITFLNKFGNLTDLQCRNNSISTLDVSNSTNLTMLKCQDNNISTLDVSSLTDLINLRCQRNNISTLEVSTLINLTELQCQTNNISTLDVSTLTNLTELQCQANSISTLDVSSLTNLIDLQCYNNAISTLDISDLTSLTTVQCENNTISNLDVSNLTILNDLRCANNQLDNLVNSRILIDLDDNGLSNGYFQSSIFGGGSLTTAGTTAKTNLQGKGWTILGL